MRGIPIGRIDGLGLKGQHGEGALVHAIQRLVLDESVEAFHAERELADGHRTLFTEPTRAEALEVLGEGVFGSVDDAQVLAPAAFNRGLN